MKTITAALCAVESLRAKLTAQSRRGVKASTISSGRSKYDDPEFAAWIYNWLKAKHVKTLQFMKRRGMDPSTLDPAMVFLGSLASQIETSFMEDRGMRRNEYYNTEYPKKLRRNLEVAFDKLHGRGTFKRAVQNNKKTSAKTETPRRTAKKAAPKRRTAKASTRRKAEGKNKKFTAGRFDDYEENEGYKPEMQFIKKIKMAGLDGLAEEMEEDAKKFRSGWLRADLLAEVIKYDHGHELAAAAHIDMITTKREFKELTHSVLAYGKSLLGRSAPRSLVTPSWLKKEVQSLR